MSMGSRSPRGGRCSTCIEPYLRAERSGGRADPAGAARRATLASDDVVAVDRRAAEVVMRALVVGATGTIGSAVADALAAKGHEVLRASRKGQVAVAPTTSALITTSAARLSTAGTLR